MQPDWRRAPVIGLMALAALLGAVRPLSAQTPTTGALSGTIVDGRGQPVVEAIVTLTEVSSGVTLEATASRRGGFFFGFLPPGDYGLTIEQLGFVPKRVTGIAIRPGRTITTTFAVRGLGGGSVGVDTEAFIGTTTTGVPVGGGQWLPGFAARGLPADERVVEDLLRTSSWADRWRTIEGLPASLSGYVIDGVRFRPAALGSQGPLDGGTGFALSGIESGQLVTNGVDVEWTGAAGALLSATSRRGTSAVGVEGAAFWSGDAIPSSGAPDGDAPAHTDLQGGAVVSGPLMSGRGRFSLGVEARRLETPLSAAWGDSPGTTAVIAADTLGLGLAAYGATSVASRDAIAAFLRAEWPLARVHQLSLTAHGVTRPGDDSGPAGMLSHEGMDVVSGVALRSSFSERMINELTVSATHSEREQTAATYVPMTRIVSEPTSFGSSDTASSARETLFRITDALHLRRGDHVIRIGGEAALGMYEYRRRELANGRHLFGDADQFSAGTGVFTRVEGDAPIADWSGSSLSVFAQDQWTAADGVDVVFGMRVERESLPGSDVRRDGEWFRLTGLANDHAGGSKWRVAPRVGVTWDVNGAHEWVVEAAGGVYLDRVDPLLLAQWQIDDGSARVRQVAGPVAWPGIPSGGTAAPRLTMLDPGFSAPLSARLSAGVTRSLGPATTLHVSGAFRRSENLPRRSDLNLLQLPAARDQYGRGVFGTLGKQGGLLYATAGTGRRFPSYDEVALITDDGWSEYWGVTLGVERRLARGLGMIGRYTYGRTTDNWFGAADGGWSMSAPAGLPDDDWVEGTSDFDVPHRLSTALVLETGPGLRLSGVYRFQSGRPFTPGFHAGVDASASGGGADPAFVDPALPGMAELIAGWDCLADAEGDFVARNACRAASTHALDLSAALRLFRIGAGSASITIDAFNVLETEYEVADAALYLVDPAAGLVVDATARTVTVPLLVNPDFGEPLIRPHTGRRIRLGILLNW